MKTLKYYIKKIEKPASDVIVLEIGDIRGQPVFSFQPGQYVMICYKNSQGRLEQKHSFSISSSPLEKRFIRLGIKIGGKFTQGLSVMKPGTEIFVQGPFGSFVFNEAKHLDLVMIAGGIGITPFMSAISMAREKNLSNRMSLIYSNRTLKGTIFLDEIRELEKANQNFKALFSVTAEKSAEHLPMVLNRRIDAPAIRDFIDHPQGKTFFICGPVPFMDAMKLNLSSLGVHRSQIETEEFAMVGGRFWPELKNIAYATGFSAGLMAVALAAINSAKPSVAVSNMSSFDPALLTQMNQAVSDRLHLISNAKSQALASLGQKQQAAAQNAQASPTVQTAAKQSAPARLAAPAGSVKNTANTLSNPVPAKSQVSSAVPKANQVTTAPVTPQPTQTVPAQQSVPAQQPAPVAPPAVTQPTPQPAPAPVTAVS